MDQAQPRQFDAGVAVDDAGAAAVRFFLLLDGYIRVIRITPGGEQIIALHIPAGQLFGIAPALGHMMHPATAMTAVDSVVLFWPARLWHKFVSRYDAFGPETGKTVGRRGAGMQDRIVKLATEHVEQRPDRLDAPGYRIVPPGDDDAPVAVVGGTRIADEVVVLLPQIGYRVAKGRAVGQNEVTVQHIVVDVEGLDRRDETRIGRGDLVIDVDRRADVACGTADHAVGHS